MENVKETKTLSICPCLTPAEFEHGARALVEGLNHNDHHKSTDCSWGLMSSEARLPCVVIKRGLHHKNQKHGEAALRREMANEPDLTLDEIEQADDEELMISHPTPVAKAFVEYQIHYHRTYEVPALYFFLRNLPNRQRLPTLEQAYEYLVSDSWKTMMRGVGVMGAISMTEHPVTGEPCFFVHPCNTADAMNELGGRRRIEDAETYLKLWIGVVGSPLGLHLPLENPW